MCRHGSPIWATNIHEHFSLVTINYFSLSFKWYFSWSICSRTLTHSIFSISSWRRLKVYWVRRSAWFAWRSISGNVRALSYQVHYEMMISFRMKRPENCKKILWKTALSLRIWNKHFLFFRRWTRVYYSWSPPNWKFDFWNTSPTAPWFWMSSLQNNLLQI